MFPLTLILWKSYKKFLTNTNLSKIYTNENQNSAFLGYNGILKMSFCLSDEFLMNFQGFAQKIHILKQMSEICAKK